MDKHRTVIFYSEEKFGKKEDPRFYCTNRLDWEARKTMQTYAGCHEVDTFYKESSWEALKAKIAKVQLYQGGKHL